MKFLLPTEDNRCRARARQRLWPLLAGIALSVTGHAAVLVACNFGRAAAPHVNTRGAVAAPAALHVRVLASEPAESAFQPQLVRSLADDRALGEPVVAALASRLVRSPLAVTATLPSQAAMTSKYAASAELDRSAVPRSAPDDNLLEGVVSSGLPMRLRLFIESDGLVSAVEILAAAQADEMLARSAQEMFRRTAFVPGRRGHQDVASYLDIEVVLDPQAPPSLPIGF